MDLCDLTVLQAKERLENKEITAYDLVVSCLSRIGLVEDKINAFITLRKKEALEEAKEIDFRRKGGEELGPLAGIPYAAKDIFCTKDIETTAASKILKGFIPPYDSTVVKRLKEAGAILLGKTNCDAFAHGSSGENSDYGITRNPYNLDYVPGGSSSGSGAAVASGECLFATGTDTGSSIRLPASFCNLVGLKPTYGLVSRYGIISMASSLDSPGILTQDIKDQEYILGIIAGPDSSDANTALAQDKLGTVSKAHLKIGLPKEYFTEGIDPEVKEIIERAAGFFKSFGHEIKEISLPHTEYGIAAYYIICHSEVSSNLSRNDGIRFPLSDRAGNDTLSIYLDTRENGFGAEAKRRIMLGTYALSSGYYEAYYEKAAKVRRKVAEDFGNVFKEVDILLAPNSPTPPFKIGEKINDPLQMYLSDVLTVPANLAGIPGLSLPGGFTGDGLPVGLQLIGPRFSEKLLFEIGYQYEKEHEWIKKRPDLLHL